MASSVFIGGGDIGTDPTFDTVTFSGGPVVDGDTANLKLNAPTGTVILGTSGDATAWVVEASGALRNGQDPHDVGASGLPVATVYIGTGIVLPGGTLLTTSGALTNGAGAQVGTMTNAPAAGNPTKWIPINDNGTVRRIPVW